MVRTHDERTQPDIFHFVLGVQKGHHKTLKEGMNSQGPTPVKRQHCGTITPAPPQIKTAVATKQ